MGHLLCDLFGHKPRTEYNIKLSGYERCGHKTFCARCKVPLNTRHRDHEWVEETAGSPCIRRKICRNCGYTIGPFTDHQFDSGQPVQEGCAVFSICSRCGEKSETKFEHLFAEETLLEGCVSFRVCQRCGQKDVGAPTHDFDEPVTAGCVVSRTCRRCNRQEVVETRHEFTRTGYSEHEYAHLLTSTTTYTCQKCGQVNVDEDQRYTDW